MARSRNIKPGFFKNEVLAEMPMEIRMLFVGLWTLADREGRLEDRPKRIKMELFPYDSFDVDPMLTRLRDDGFLTRYEVAGVRFVQIENFVKHQDPHYKEKASEIPAPPDCEDIIKATLVTRSQRVRILERDDYTCQGCASKEHLCIDHIIPVSRGGDSSDDNLQVLCHSCNSTKGNKLDGEAKGVKKSKHSPTSVLTRVNVGSNLNQEKRPSPSEPLIPDSLNSDSLPSDSLTTAAAASVRVAGSVEEEFEAAWLAYPSRPGHSKAAALKAWKARAADGESMEAMRLGAVRYAAYVEAERTEARFVKHAATFFGPDRHYANDWTPPPPPAVKPPRSFAEQEREAGQRRWEEMTGERHPDLAGKQAHDNVIDVFPDLPRTLGAPA